MKEACKLYGITHSLFTGRARSYLIKNGISFQELSTGHESFKAEVLPQAKLPTIPTLVTPGGDVIRDGAAIIEHFEVSNGRPNRPVGPRQQVLSALFDVIGTDGLLRPAMHYRWNFQDDNLAFVRYHFFHSQRETPTRDEKTERMMGRMQHVARIWGVNEETSGLVEELYLEYLKALDEHFERFPYLLGGRPSIGDFGLLAPMYAHLGRDPYPARLMQQQAPRVYRWVERMNRPDQDAPEYFDVEDDYLANDQVPESLLRVLSIIAEDFVPETESAAECINQWLVENTPEAGAAADRMLGECEFSVRGHSIKSVSQPYRFFLLQRVQSSYEAMCAGDQAAVEKMLVDCGMEAILKIKLNRHIQQSGNLEVWV